MLCRWNKKHSKHSSKHGDDKGNDYKKSEEYKKKKGDNGKYAVEEEDEEWYESKVDTDAAAKLTGYEPEIYCKKMEVKMAA